MIVELRKLQPNPMRDFTVDPIDPERVEALKASIKEDGFWGGVVCHEAADGTVHIVAGHHRVKAALAAGIKTADLFVTCGMDEAAMVRIYARENATQRGNSGTAQTGSVAAALRFVAKAVLGGGVSEEFFRHSQHSRDVVRGQLMSEKGLGRDVIVRFLTGIPGINDGTVQQSLANLKASGDYARVIREVQEQIEREHKEALKALAKAEKAAKEAAEAEARAEAERKEAAAKAKAAREEADRKRAELERQRAEAEAKLAEKRRKEAEEQMKQFDALRKTRDSAAKASEAASAAPITFDFEGVAKHLKNPHQIDVFRQRVTSEGIRPLLPVANQAALAGHLVKLAKERDAELTGAFIKENISGLVTQFKDTRRRMDKEERERLLREDLHAQARQHWQDFNRGCGIMSAAALRLKELHDKWPKDLPFVIPSESRALLDTAKRTIDALNERI